MSDTGILPDRMIAALAKAGGILPAYDFAPDQIQPASLEGWRHAPGPPRPSRRPLRGLLRMRRNTDRRLTEGHLDEKASPPYDPRYPVVI